MKPKRSQIRRVLLLGDTHTGCVFSPLPQPFSMAEGAGDYRAGPIMRWMNERWAEMVEWSDTPHHLVLMGDLIEGFHHRTTQIITSNTEDHFRGAVALLEPLAERVRGWGGKVYVIRGTECHVGQTESCIGHVLGAERDPVSRMYAFDQLNLTVCGTACSFQHHAPTTARPWTRGTAMSVAGAYNRLNAIEAGISPPRVVATAHAHTGRVYIDAAGVTVATYAWQALTRHGHKVVPSAVTTVGAHMLDWTNRPDGEDPDVLRYQRTLNLEGSTLHA